MTIRGEPAFERGFYRATTLYSVGPRTRTMMQSYASVAKLRSGGPILCYGVISHGVHRVTATSNRHRRPVTSGRAGPKRLGAFSVLRSLCGTQNDAVRHHALRTSRHRASSGRQARALTRAPFGLRGLTPTSASNRGPPCDRRLDVAQQPIAIAGSKGLPVFRTPKHSTNSLRIAATTICLGLRRPRDFNRVTSARIAGLYRIADMAGM
jgi:hypothetical protein